MSPIDSRDIADNEAWADMSDAQRWSYVLRLEKAVTDSVKEIGRLRQLLQRCEEATR
jgi:hypothetical protein